MEIERKWFVNGWPEHLSPQRIYDMEQGYLARHPTVRIRRESERGGETAFILCFKGKGKLAREEIELEIDKTTFRRLEGLLSGTLIPKERRDYCLHDGSTLEVNRVDAGAETEFFYAEVEFDSKKAAHAWSPEHVGLESYLREEVTERKGVSMAAYWERTRNGTH